MKNLSRKLLISILTAVFAMATLGTATFAWFTMSGSAQINQFTATIKGGEGFEICVTLKGKNPDFLTADPASGSAWTSAQQTLYNADSWSDYQTLYPNAAAYYFSTTASTPSPIACSTGWISGTVTSEQMQNLIASTSWMQKVDASGNKLYWGESAHTTEVTTDGGFGYPVSSNVILNAATLNTSGAFVDMTGTAINMTDVRNVKDDTSVIEFDIHLRPKEAGTIHLTAATEFGEIGGVSDFTFDKGGFKLADNTTTITEGNVYEFSPTASARLMFAPTTATAAYSSNILSSRKIYEMPAEAATSGSPSTAGNTEGKIWGAELAPIGSVAYYNLKVTNAAEQLQYSNFTAVNAVVAETAKLGTAAMGDVDFFTATTADITANRVFTYTASIWIEGWDGECLNALLTNSLGTVIAFSFDQAE